MYCAPHWHDPLACWMTSWQPSFVINLDRRASRSVVSFEYEHPPRSPALRQFSLLKQDSPPWNSSIRLRHTFLYNPLSLPSPFPSHPCPSISVPYLTPLPLPLPPPPPPATAAHHQSPTLPPTSPPDVPSPQAHCEVTSILSSHHPH